MYNILHFNAFILWFYSNSEDILPILANFCFYFLNVEIKILELEYVIGEVKKNRIFSALSFVHNDQRLMVCIFL